MTLTLDRRRFLALGAATAAAAASVTTPERLFAAAAPAGWQLGFHDVESDIAPTGMRLIHGRGPSELGGDLYRNGPPGSAVGRAPAATGSMAMAWCDVSGSATVVPSCRRGS